MPEKEDCSARSFSSTAAESETVQRGAARFREKLQRLRCAKSKASLRDKIKSAVKLSKNKVTDKVQSSSPTRSSGNKMNKQSRDTGEAHKKAHGNGVTESKRDKDKGKNYPTPRSAREPRELTEEEMEEVRRRRRVHDTKVGGRSVKGGFKFRKFDRLGSQPGRRRMDRIYSVEDSDEESERELAFGYGNW